MGDEMSVRKSRYSILVFAGFVLGSLALLSWNAGYAQAGGGDPACGYNIHHDWICPGEEARAMWSDQPAHVRNAYNPYIELIGDPRDPVPSPFDDSSFYPSCYPAGGDDLVPCGPPNQNTAFLQFQDIQRAYEGSSNQARENDMGEIVVGIGHRVRVGEINSDYDMSHFEHLGGERVFRVHEGLQHEDRPIAEQAMHDWLAANGFPPDYPEDRYYLRFLPTSGGTIDDPYGNFDLVFDFDPGEQFTQGETCCGPDNCVESPPQEIYTHRHGAIAYCSSIEIDDFFAADSAEAWALADSQMAQCGFHPQDSCMRIALASVAFKLGPDWSTEHFPEVFGMMCDGEYLRAAAVIERSSWKRNSPGRAQDFQNALEDLHRRTGGEDPGPDCE